MEEHSLLKKGVALSLNDERECHVRYKGKARAMFIKIARQDIIDSENLLPLLLTNGDFPPENAIQLIRWAFNIEKAFFSNETLVFDAWGTFHPTWDKAIPFKDLAKKALKSGLETVEGFKALSKILVGLDYVYDRSGIRQKIVL